MRPRATAVLAIIATTVLMALAPAALAAPHRASLTDIEPDIMCVLCHESLAVAQSPQATAERDDINTLIAQGETKSQIERWLVAQFGPAVLARPPAHGFNLTVYILPPAVLLIGAVALAFTLPRWRARTRAAAARDAPASTSPPTGEDARRLEADLANFKG